MKTLCSSFLRSLFRILRGGIFVLIRLLTFFSIKKNKILFISYNGKSVFDNPGYIYSYLVKSHKECSYVFAINKHTDFVTEENTKYVLFGRFLHIKLYFHLCTSRVIVNNSRLNFLLLLRKKQLYIQTWHGGGAQKKCEKDAEDKLEKTYIHRAISESKKTDLFLSDSRFMTNLYYSSFWYEGAVFESGFPRFDILLQNNLDPYKKKVCSRYGIDEKRKIALYAPTFRVKDSLSVYDVDFSRLLLALAKRFGGEFVLLARLHPNLEKESEGNVFGIDVINASDYPDSQELLAASDVLIGDYSSINFDFSLMRRPVFRYLPDLLEYNDDRGLYFPVEDYPYPYSVSNDELEKAILSFNLDAYFSKLAIFEGRIGFVASTNAAESVGELIIQFILAKDKKSFFNDNRKSFIYKSDLCSGESK